MPFNPKDRRMCVLTPCLKLAGNYLVNKWDLLSVCCEVEVSSCWKKDINGTLQGYTDLTFLFLIQDLESKTYFKIFKCLLGSHFWHASASNTFPLMCMALCCEVQGTNDLEHGKRETRILYAHEAYWLFFHASSQLIFSECLLYARHCVRC